MKSIIYYFSMISIFFFLSCTGWKDKKNMESDIIKISHLNKSFGEVKAVNDLSFRVKKGELFAFLGVNGAGKSTTISILCGLLKKDSGTVQVNGIETDKAGAQIKRMLGVVFQDSVLDKPLTVKENLMSRAALYGITGNAFDKRLQELVEILDFDEAAKKILLGYGWPGNVRELKQVVHAAVLICGGKLITPQYLRLQQAGKTILNLAKEEKINNCLLKDEQRNAEQIRMAVTISKGNLTQAAALLGISRPTLYKKMGMYGITKEQV